MALTEQETNRRLVPFGTKLAIYRRQVEVELAGILGLELANLEFHHEEAVEPHVIEEQVQVERLVGHGKGNLAADECEAATEFQ